MSLLASAPAQDGAGNAASPQRVNSAGRNRFVIGSPQETENAAAGIPVEPNSPASQGTPPGFEEMARLLATITGLQQEMGDMKADLRKVRHENEKLKSLFPAGDQQEVWPEQEQQPEHRTGAVGPGLGPMANRASAPRSLDYTPDLAPRAASARLEFDASRKFCACP